MRQLAEASRGQTVPAEPVPAEPVPAEPVPAEPGPAEPVPAEPGPPLAAETETAAVVRARLSAAVPEMIEVIGRGVPEYARQEQPDYSQRLAGAVTGAVAQFIALLAQPGRSTQASTAEFRAIGGTAAREGRTLDALQDALRLGARVAWPGCARPTPGSTCGS